MADNMTFHPIKPMTISISSIKQSIAALFATTVLALPAYAAEQEWWFDVEVILFKRNLDATKISEKFKQSKLALTDSDYLDVLTPYLKPDISYLLAGLPYCRASNRQAVQKQYDQDFAFPETVAKTSDSLSSQPVELKNQQEQQTSSGLVTRSDEITTDNFQYEVATTDIFAPPNNTAPSALVTDADADADANDFSKSEAINNVNLERKTHTELTAPIQVEFIEWQIPSQILCAYAEQIDPSFASMSYLQTEESDALTSNQIEQVPVVIDGIQWQKRRSAFLLPTSNMRMTDLYEKIKKQRDITPMLHINWRQEVTFGRDKGQTFRLFAGKNFADKFDANGLAIVDDTEKLSPSTVEYYLPEEERLGLTSDQQQAEFSPVNGQMNELVTKDLFAQIDAALADDTPINMAPVKTRTVALREIDSALLSEIWQIDGTINVYLRNVGRVPYLHIDSNLDYRQAVYDQEIALSREDLSTNVSNNLANNVSGQNAIVVGALQQPDSLQPAPLQQGTLQADSVQQSTLQNNYLQSANFNQLRRVISKQVHYFDHPLFGMLVQINRYRWPEVIKDDIDNTDHAAQNN